MDHLEIRRRKAEIDVRKHWLQAEIEAEERALLRLQAFCPHKNKHSDTGPHDTAYQCLDCGARLS